MAVLFWLLACVLLLSGCPESGDGKPAEAPAVEPVNAELRNDSGQLTYMRGGEEVWSGRIDGALPYRIVAQGPPVVLTVVGPGLELASWAVDKEAVEYPAMIPLVVEPPLVALGRLTDGEASLGRVSLLNADGSEMWVVDQPARSRPASERSPASGTEASRAPAGCSPVGATHLSLEAWRSRVQPPPEPESLSRPSRLPCRDHASVVVAVSRARKRSRLDARWRARGGGVRLSVL